MSEIPTISTEETEFVSVKVEIVITLILKRNCNIKSIDRSYHLISNITAQRNYDMKRIDVERSK